MATWDSLRRRTVDRNRLNQRNFRTRRQAYVKELEQRIRKLEDEGVWATKEVQFAAQQVQKENRLLRSLLETQFGVDAYQISKYLFELNNATDINAQKSLQLGNRMGRSGVSEELASNCMLATNPGEAGRARATQDFNFTGPTRAHEEKQGVESSPEFPDYGYRSPLTLSTGMDTLQPVQSANSVTADAKLAWVTTVVLVVSEPHLKRLISMLKRLRARKPQGSLQVFVVATTLTIVRILSGTDLSSIKNHEPAVPNKVFPCFLCRKCVKNSDHVALGDSFFSEPQQYEHDLPPLFPVACYEVYRGVSGIVKRKYTAKRAGTVLNATMVAKSLPIIAGQYTSAPLK
ncbi:hypothetical protein CLAIMM_08148 [Cladophialophora immunda]|nr:hypothetical protein CLAIMM_08148 [Cladophialophora immunda]